MAKQRAVLQYAAELLKGTLATEHTGGPATCVRIGSADVHVSLTEDSPPVMQATSHVLRDVDASAELLAALNHISANTPFVRVFHRDRDVLVMGDLLLDHIGSTWPPVYAAQWLLERITIRAAGEHFTRRQLPLVTAAGFQVMETERLKAGTVARIHAVKPA